MFFVAAATPPYLAEVAALLVCGALIAYICQRLGLVPIVGFLVAGVIIGPHALGLVREQEMVDAVAEIGVILLLFTIGIEFSLERLARIKSLILGGGSLQVGLATAATAVGLALIGVHWRTGVFTGLLVALSSTAIVLKLLADRGETNTEYGQVSLGLLIFQDLAIIVMVLSLPMLAGQAGDATDLIVALAKAALIIVAVLQIARRVMPPVLERVARTCSPELFLLTVVAICFGTALLTSLAGVSVSLGAFLAGLIVSESRFSQHAFSEIMPLQILFSAMFFVSVGMLLDVEFLLRNLPLVLTAVVVVAVIKIATTAAAVRVLGYSVPTAIASGLALAQVGEFSFVLERTGHALGLSPAGMGAPGSQSFIATTVLLMVATPLLTRLGGSVARTKRPSPSVETTSGSPATQAHHTADGQVVIAGYGVTARHLVRVLTDARIPYVITTLSPEGALEAETQGLPVVRGDSTKQLTLTHAGIRQARMVVIADDDTPTSHRITSVARVLAPEARILVKTRYSSDAAHLLAGGADIVVAEDAESTIEVAAEVLRVYGVLRDEIEALQGTLRRSGYAALREAPDSGRALVPAPTIEAASKVAGKVVDGPVSSSPWMPGRARVLDTEHRVALDVKSGNGCPHTAGLTPVLPRSPGCEECLRLGDTWVHLRLCMTCGHVGCCDTSKNAHATSHHHATGHPIVRSVEPGETWAWCYVDRRLLE